MERAIGVSQSRVHIVSTQCRTLRKLVMHDIMNSFVILHNIVVECVRPLAKLVEKLVEVANISVQEDVQCRFERHSPQEFQIVPSSIAALCAINILLHSASEYTDIP